MLAMLAMLAMPARGKYVRCGAVLYGKLMVGSGRCWGYWACDGV